MKNLIRHLISLVLPITMLVIVPSYYENDISIKNELLFILGILLMLTGLTMMVLTITSFNRIGKGTLAPWSPTKRLVIVGLYRYVRNPMIIGVLTILLGESVAISSRGILTWTGIFFIINNIYFVLYEEPDLERKFGEEYREYKKNVHRWVPRLKPYQPSNE